MYHKKICILGASEVGKSSLVDRFLNGKFSEAYLSNAGARIDKLLQTVDRERVQIMLWDIQGENQASDEFLGYLKGASAIIYVVDGTRLETLRAAIELRRVTEKRLGNTIPSIMLFNKVDLVGSWEVSANIITNIESNGIFAILTSCKEGTGVDTAFHLIMRVMMGKTALMTNISLPSSQPGIGGQTLPHF